MSGSPVVDPDHHQQAARPGPGAAAPPRVSLLLPGAPPTAPGAAQARRGHVRSRAWTPVGHGLYRPAEAADPWLAAVQAYHLALPASAAFTHLTAARLRGWWLPPLPAGLPMFASVEGFDSGRPCRAGLVVGRLAPPLRTEMIGDLPVTQTCDTLLALARDLSLLDLVVAVDSALHLGHVDLSELVRCAARRRRGAPRLRQAIALADGRSESPYETLLRILHAVIKVATVPQLVVEDGHGVFVARGDLWLVGTRMLHEYDGAEHLAKARQRADLRRGRRLEAASWGRRGYTDADLLYRAVGILRDCDATLDRPHRPERVRPWHELLRRSCYTTSGRQQLLARLGLATGAAAAGSSVTPE